MRATDEVYAAGLWQGIFEQIGIMWANLKVLVSWIYQDRTTPLSRKAHEVLGV